MNPFVRPVAIVVLVAALAGCDRHAEDKRRVEETVRRYNQLLSQGYQSLNMTPLTEVAEMEQASKVYSHMAALGEARTKMLPVLKEVTFSDFRFPNVSSASVGVREVWDFRHVNIDTQQMTLEEKGFAYDLVYRLTLKEGRWMVREVKSTDKGDKGAAEKR